LIERLAGLAFSPHNRLIAGGVATNGQRVIVAMVLTVKYAD